MGVLILILYYVVLIRGQLYWPEATKSVLTGQFPTYFVTLVNNVVYPYFVCIRTENDNVKRVIWWYPHWERQRQNSHMMVSALRTTTSKQSYDGIRTENDNVKTVIWRYPSYDGFAVVVLSADTIIWRFWRCRSQCRYRHMTVLTLSFSVRIPSCHMTVSALRTTTSKQSYDGISTENDNGKTVIWWY
jgi:hypothetical protein